MTGGGHGPALVLASGSPRRRHLLEEAGYRFAVVPPHVDESPLPAEAADDMVRRLAVDKARAVADVSPPGSVVLGVDTTVALGAVPIGKPRDATDAVRILLSLAGVTHTVYTGYAVVDTTGTLESGIVATRVTLRSIPAEEAEEYAATGEPLDKAGAYAAQGEGGKFIERLEGSFTNVMGLPMETMRDTLGSFGVWPDPEVSADIDS